MEEKREKLFTEFPPVSTEEWMEVVTKDLKGKPFEKRLVWRTSEGFNLNPFYRAEDIEQYDFTEVLPGEYPYIRGTKSDNNWLVRQDVALVEDPKALNQQILDIVDRGVESLGIHFLPPQVSAENITTILRGVDLERIEINLYVVRQQSLLVVEALLEALKTLGVDPKKVHGSIGYNPFRHLLGTGEPYPEAKEMAVALFKAIEALPNFTCFTIHSCDFVNAGAYSYQELGYALSAGVEVMEQVAKEAGVSKGKVAERIRFDMGVGSNYFMEMAKFRAVRWLWALVVKAADKEASERATKIIVHGETAFWNKTSYDAHVNLLRTTTEAMSATIAGVHSFCVRPFDVTYSHGDDFSWRIARNQQLLLKEESHFDHVADPAGGSYYIEHLTKSLAEEGWKLFLEVEAEGGFSKLAHEGKVQEAINASNEARHKAVANRRENLLGTNIFPNFTETAKHEMLHPEVKPKQEVHPTTTALDMRRGASDFEELRMATDRAEKRPKVFMLTIGNLAMRLARAQFSSNFFATGGYQIIDNLGFETVQDGVDAAKKAGADIIVLCSSDEEYATLAPEAFDIIKGEVPLVIAGAPECMEDLKAKGIEHFIHVRVNVLETMQMFHKLLNIGSK